jgi:hypothetical protein
MDPFLPGPDVRTTTAGELPTVGAAWLGAQTDEDLPDPANNIPIIRATEKAFGMRPASAGNLYAGIETAPGVSIGRIYIGGTVTGLVDIKGDCLEFYANNILTGTANGIGSGATSDIHSTQLPCRRRPAQPDGPDVVRHQQFGGRRPAKPVHRRLHHRFPA